MQLITRLALLFVAIGLVQADLHNAHHGRSNHGRISRRHPHPLGPKQVRDADVPRRRADNPTARCKTRSSTTSTSTSTSQVAKPTPVVNNAEVKPSTSAKAKEATPQTSAPTTSAPSSGLMKVVSQQCGSSGATAATSKTSGPNGNIDWLNCGVDGGGWNPPLVKVGDLQVKDLRAVVGQSNSIFQPCAPYIDMFEQFSAQYNVPTIIMASIAMQESTCNPNTVGGAGEQGIMQITRDKCQGRSDADCRDPSFNIQQGIAFFASTLADCGGNVLETIGRYNGWAPGMTIGSATAAAHTGCCRCQNNLDYLQQTLNAWTQGIDPYSNDIGKYFNLNVCST